MYGRCGVRSTGRIKGTRSEGGWAEDKKNRGLIARADGNRTRVSQDALGTPLGFVSWQGAAGPAWWRGLRGAVLAVYETEDESLVFQVHRSWVPTPRWQVRDADAHPVGTVRHFRI